MSGKNAFYSALAEFPPLDLPADMMIAVVVPESEGEALEPKQVKDAATAFDDDIDLLVEVESTSSDVASDIRFAYEKLAAYRDAENRKDRPTMRKIELLASTTGAVQMLRAAASNSNKFTLEVVPKFLQAKVEPEETLEDASRRVKHISMLEEILQSVHCPHCGKELECATCFGYGE